MIFVCVLTESTGVFLFVFSLNPQVFFVCVCTESTSRSVGGKQVPVDIVAQFYAGIGM